MQTNIPNKRNENLTIVSVIGMLIMTVVPMLNPARVSGLISRNSALITMSISYRSLSD